MRSTAQLRALTNPRKRVKPRHAKRAAENWQRAYGSEERVAFIKRLCCLACGIRGCDNVHIETGGTSRKADASKIVPLCRMHHRELHTIGRESFESCYSLDLEKSAAALDLWYRGLYQ